MDGQGQVENSKKYEGPVIPAAWDRKTLGRTQASPPRYLDGQGRVYDAFYQRCPDSIEKNVIEALANDAPFPSLTYPGDNRYPSFFDYEEAVLEWKKQVESVIANIKIPKLLGRAYPRPRVMMVVRFECCLRVRLEQTSLTADQS